MRRRSSHGSNHWHFDRLATQPELRYNLAASDLLRSLRIGIGPQEWATVAQSLLHARFGVTNVGTKTLQRFRLQRYGSCSLCHSAQRQSAAPAAWILGYFSPCNCWAR